MPRPAKKADDKLKGVIPATTMVMPPVIAGLVPPVNPSAGPRVVDNESFLRVRDSAVSRLSTILELLRSFTNDYIRQTSLLLGEQQGDVNELINSFDPSAAAAGLMLPVGDLAAPPAEEKKERKKRTHDPNAPKRPLTPYFLYMQHARSIIANDLGAEAPKGAVQEEGQRRWANMTPHEKQGWNNAYQYNLRLYNARVHSYKAGNPEAKNMTDEGALKYAEEFSIPMPDLKDASKTENVQAAIAEQLQDDSAKTPKKSATGRKRKSDIPVTEVETPKGGPASPDKKRRRTSTKAVDDKDDGKKSARKNKK
ncbi:high mobility group protein [Cordyceps fumosorosea ARSEF 2679]|uniref:High mobility group protein n=1 Tax=Cordyceps fumosorosea (strain ARSEF 2679) TaxID=1081104 RepID=A0A167V0W4_CORFA|nr:high mobility group protein [Cordyceps fumosorosea ARSEF 2679]OAA62105.1 high mobility group protein [Cordyceps fumosorosea ARSEF 2679]